MSLWASGKSGFKCTALLKCSIAEAVFPVKCIACPILLRGSLVDKGEASPQKYDELPQTAVVQHVQPPYNVSTELMVDAAHTTFLHW